MKLLIWTQLCIVLFGTIILAVFGQWNSTISYFLSSGLWLINLTLTGWVWNRVFNKKNIALTIAVIVFKYAFIALIVFKVAQTSLAMKLPVFSGLLSVVVSSVIWALITNFKNERPDRSGTF